MQTFVPYGANFDLNARVLDRQRLGKQRVEAWQILNALRGLSKGWTNHPATVMWRDHQEALAHYAIAMCDEWIARGYNDTMRDRFVALAGRSLFFTDLPVWLNRQDVMLSHRSNLIRKRPDIYGPIWPDVSDDLPYVWPLANNNHPTLEEAP